MKEQNDGSQILSQASWIWPQINFYDLYNSYAHFRKDFHLSDNPQEAWFFITADQAYRLWINGSYVTRGPARGFQSHWPYDRIEVSGYLRKGANYISVEVYNAGISTFGYLTQTRAGLLCAGDFGETKIRSDASWISRLDRSHKRDTARYSVQLNFQEHIDTRKDNRKWITERKPPKGWNSPEETVYGSMPWHGLEERGIPQLGETARQPEKIVSRGSGSSKRGYRNWRNIVWGLFREFGGVEWKAEITGFERNGAVEIQPAGRGRFSAVVLDMGETVVGPSRVRLEGGSRGMVVDFFYHERLGENLEPVILDTETQGCRQAMGNRMIVSDRKSECEFFHMLGFRYITVVVRENTEPVALKLDVLDTGYPYKISGGFESSDAALNGIWKICRRTQQVCSLDAYVDTPWREQAQWWGDARIQFWNTMAIDNDVRLFKRGIRSIARQRVPNGLTYGHAPTMAHNCILPDFSLVWIMTVYDYYRQTKDLSLFEEQLPRIREVLSYFNEEAPRYKGLLCYDKRYWLFLDWSNLRKEGAPTLYNMWYLAVLRTLALLHGLSGHVEEAERLNAQAGELQSILEELLFDEAEGLFADGIGEDGVKFASHSVHSQTFALMLGLKPKYHDNMVSRRIIPFLKGEKLDVPVPSTYWCSYVLSVAREKGLCREALDFVRRMWGPMIPLSTCPEVFDGISGHHSASHAWSAHPLFHLQNIVGGVVQESDGWDSIIYEPYFAKELDFAKVVVPTPHGPVASSWKRDGKLVNVSLVLPEGMSANIRIPGYESRTTGSFGCVFEPDEA